MHIRNLLVIPALLCFCATVALSDTAPKSAHADIFNAQGTKIGTAKLKTVSGGVQIKVSDIQVRDPLTATTGLDVIELRRGMLERHARYVPVIDGPTLLGVVSFHDVAKAVYEEQSFENRMLKSYIKNWPDADEQ